MDDKDQIEFDIELADIGMRFGALIAISLVLFSSGVVLLFSTIDKLIQNVIDSLKQTNPIPIQLNIAPFLMGEWIAGGALLVGGIILLFGAISWKKRKLDKLKKKHLKETEAPKKEMTCKNCFVLLLLCKRYDGIER
ncbi:MAG: hypothetical protein ABI342_00505 [Nitrososphaera sp.]|jgi:hypothetical protein